MSLVLGLVQGWFEQATATLRTAAEASPTRTSWSQDGSTCVALQGIADPDKAELVEQVADRLRALAGVRWVEVNAALGCLVVGHDEAVIEAAELVSEVDDSVELVGLTGYFAETSVAHPASPGEPWDTWQ
ncbi:hypothetical protein [Saccharopolyspora sp. SCSIO 74807]|uniref:hypothetical protein n=2 Tax=Saccharopolyspora TaxID=1835 RepID=UPI0030CD6508